MISRPSVTLSIIPASQLAGVQDQKVLAIGQMTSHGSATSGALVQNIGNDSAENDLFGQTSHLAGIIRAFKSMNKKTRIDAIPLDDASGTPANSSITFSGTATEDGTLTITVGSERRHSVDVPVVSGDTAAEVASAAVTAFANADYVDSAPFTAAANSAVITFTSVHDGTLGNTYDLKLSGSVAGIAAVVAGWGNGATNPSLTDVFDVISNIRYQTVIWPCAYDIDVIQTELEARFNLTNDVKDGVAVQVIVETLADAKTYVEDLNSQSLVIIPNNPVDTDEHVGAAILEMPDVICAQVCAIRALRMTQDAPLSQFQSTVSRSDQYGGPEIASLPYFNTALPYIPVSNPSEFFSVEDVDEMENSGLSIIGPNRAYNETILGEFVTTYLTDNAGNQDTSYKYLNTIDTASVIREYFFQNMKKRYCQSRLTSGDLIAGRDMANASSIRSFCNMLYDELSDMTLVKAGTDAKKTFNENLIIELNIAEGKATVDMAPELVGQFRTAIGTLQINFGA